MGFIRSCYIRKNTPELRSKLASLGLMLQNKKIKYEEFPALMVMNGIIYPAYLIKPSRFYNVTDCGTNEEAFIAIASIRDDTDKNQWFISLKDCFDLDIEPMKAGDWRFNPKYDKLPRRLRKIWKRATLKEIIEHFKSESE